MGTQAIDGAINQWGNGLAVRINKTLAKAAGVSEGTAVRITAEPGRIVIETVQKEQSLSQMLEAFDPQRHGGEAMAYPPVGAEVI